MLHKSRKGIIILSFLFKIIMLIFPPGGNMKKILFVIIILLILFNFNVNSKNISTNKLDRDSINSKII